jgi:RNA polymerase sigma-32 factor
MGIEPTNAVLALRLGVTEAEVAEMDLRINKKERSISVPVGSSEEGAAATLGDVITDNTPDPEHMNMNEDERAVVRAAVETYRKTLTNEKEIMILDNRIMSEEPLTLQELGDKVGVSRERMRQLEARVMLGLRMTLEDTL